jgi:hypothetical protein
VKRTLAELELVEGGEALVVDGNSGRLLYDDKGERWLGQLVLLILYKRWAGRPELARAPPLRPLLVSTVSFGMSCSPTQLPKILLYESTPNAPLQSRRVLTSPNEKEDLDDEDVFVDGPGDVGK